MNKKKKNIKVTFKKKNLKINFKNIKVTFKKKLQKIRRSCVQIITTLEFSIEIIFNDLLLWIRNLISTHVTTERFPLIFLNSYSISTFTQMLLYLLSKKNLVLLFKAVYEDIGKIRNIITIEIIKNFKKKGPYPNVVLLLSNQTILIQVLRKFYTKIVFNKYTNIFLNKKKFKSIDFLFVKNGYTIDPADKRSCFSEGYSTIFSCSVSLSENYLLFKLNFKNSHVTFISLAKICKISKKKFFKIFLSLKFCLFDNLNKILAFDFESFLNIFKKILICKKKHVIFQTYRNFNIADYFSFQIVVISNSICIQNFNILLNLTHFFSSLEHQYALSRKIKKIFPRIQSLFRLTKNTKVKIKEKFFFFINQFNYLLKSKISGCLLIFTPNFFEYILLRNFIWKYEKIKDFQVFALNECSDKNKNLIKNIKNKKITIMTENFYFFNRNVLKNISEVIFFSPPLSMEFFFEICSFLHNNWVNHTNSPALISSVSGLIYIRAFL